MFDEYPYAMIYLRFGETLPEEHAFHRLGVRAADVIE